MIYRVKTKEEFVREYGERWRTQLNEVFVGSMDYLLGGILRKYRVVYDHDKDITMLKVRDERYPNVDWSVTMDMVVPAREEKIKTIVKRMNEK